MINISVHLYGKPEWDLPTDDKRIDGNMLREQGDYLKKHLYNVADITEKLRKSGWNCSGALYSLEFCKEGVTKQEAMKELKKLDISSKEINLIEFEDEEEE